MHHTHAGVVDDDYAREHGWSPEAEEAGESLGVARVWWNGGRRKFGFQVAGQKTKKKRGGLKVVH